MGIGWSENRSLWVERAVPVFLEGIFVLQSNERFPPNFYLGQLTLTPGHPPAHQNGGGELPETPKTGNCSEERKSSTTKFGEERKSE